MISPQKIHANQRNALRSTGPRTPAGKQYSARNAQKHGLSMLSVVLLEDPGAQAIAELLTDEGISVDEARRIAQNILAYERNEAHQREVFTNQCAIHLSMSVGEVQTTLQETGQVIKEGVELYRTGVPVIGARCEEAQMLGLLLHFATTVNKRLTRYARRAEREDASEQRQARRYFKRAANQLARAVRALA